MLTDDLEIRCRVASLEHDTHVWGTQTIVGLKLDGPVAASGAVLELDGHLTLAAGESAPELGEPLVLTIARPAVAVKPLGDVAREALRPDFGDA